MLRRFLIILLIVVAAGFLAAILFIHLFIHAERVEKYANELIGGEYKVQISEAAFKPFSQTLELGGVSIQTNSKQGIFEADQIVFEQIGLVEAFRGNVWVKSISVNNFFLDQALFPDEQETGGEEERAFNLFFGEVDLKNGDISFKAGEDGTGTILGLYLKLGSVKNKFGCTDCAEDLKIENINIEIAEINYRFWENRYELGLQSISINEADSLMTLGNLALKSTQTREGFFDSLEYRTDHFSVDLSGFSIHGIDFSEIKQGNHFSASSISVDSLGLHVTLDKRVPRNPDLGEPPMPLEALGNLPVQLSVDSLLVNHADIRYSEIHEEGERPGTITFARTGAKISPIYSDLSEPVVMTAQSYLENAGEINTEFRFSMEDGMPVTRIKGSLGRFDVTLLNNIFKDLEGILITGGFIYRSDFEYTMRGGQASGVFMVHYDNLSLAQIDKIDHSQGFKDRVTSFFMDRIAIRGSSQHNGEDFRRGEIDEEQAPEKGFFNYVWISLRSGIMDAIGRL